MSADSPATLNETQTRPATILVDAAQLQIVLRRRHAKFFDPDQRVVAFDEQWMEDQFSAIVFWSMIGIEIQSLSAELNLDPYEKNGRMSLYVFDAQYDESLVNEISSSATFLKKGYEEKIRSRAEQASVIYSFSLAFPGDPEFNPDVCLVNHGEFTISRVPQKVFNYRDSPNHPGLYMGFVGNDRRELAGVSQKTVDTMLLLSGLLKANENRDIVLLGADMDFLPLANYVLSSGQHFHLRAPFAPHEKWCTFEKCAGYSCAEMKFEKFKFNNGWLTAATTE